MARHITLPSFLSTKRSKVITVAAAGTLTLATVISAAVGTVPSPSPASATADAGFMTTIGQQAAQTTRQPAMDGIQQAILFKAGVFQAEQSEQVSVAKAAARKAEAAAARAAAAKAAAARAAAAKAAAARAAAARAAARAAAAKAAAAKALAAKAAAVQAAQRATQRAQQATVTVASGSPQQIAQQLLSKFGWPASQFACLQPLWERESGWNVTAQNPSSGAYGIPQALPGSKMASAGADWPTDAATQIRWGLTYIKGSYGSPCGAWAHEQASGWY